MKKKKLKYSIIKYGIEVFDISGKDIECWECGEKANYMLAGKAGFYCSKCLKK